MFLIVWSVCALMFVFVSWMPLWMVVYVCACIYMCVCSVCSYRNLATEHETLMQKYLHLLQIVETEKTVAKQLRQQIEDGEIEIERLKSEVKFVIHSALGIVYL